MTDEKKKRLLLLILAPIIPIIVLVSFLLLPSALKSNPALTSLGFVKAEQSNNNSKLTLSGSFNRALPLNEKVWVYCENAEVEIAISGQRYLFNSIAGTPDIFNSPGSGWFSFSSPQTELGDPVEIKINSYYNQNEAAAASLLSRIYIGDGGGLYRLMLNQIDFFGLVLICAIISGVIYLLEGAIDIASGIFAEGTRIALFGFYCLAGGIWCVPDVLYPFLSLLISPLWLSQAIDVIGLLLFPIASTMILRFYIKTKRSRTIVNAVLLAEVIIAVGCVVVQLLGIFDLMMVLPSLSVVFLSTVGIVVVCLIFEVKLFRSKSLLLLFLTVLPVFLCGIVDCINAFGHFMPKRVLLQYSFALSIILLVLQLIISANEENAKAKAMKQMESELVDSRISIMLSQISPHFLYNSLLGIKQLCDTNPKKASDALEHFSYYLRGNLNSFNEDRLVPFSKEVEHVKDYLYLEKMRFEERVNVEWQLEITDFLLPPLTLQPIVENAVRHGITKQNKGGTIIIKSEATPQNIVISVIDDGVGFDTNAEPDKTRPHIGIENVKGRLDKLCGGEIKVTGAPDIGTEAKIILPRKDVFNENTCSR